MKIKLFYTALVLPLLFCVIACENENQINQDFSGKLVTHSSCKYNKSTLEEPNIPDTVSCVQYAYDATSGKLNIKHINAGFNCCPEKLSCTFSLVGDTVTIEEAEEDGFCDCLCLYDLDIEVTGIGAKGYVLKFVEPYWRDQEPLVFNINLAAQSSGSHCMIRKKYPWIEF
ncbi:MAG: hypothetical protein JXB00_02420 [Bacteroidales bacterium]|nr:hypothetical protein [Bacteroidales bacterium]